MDNIFKLGAVVETKGGINIVCYAKTEDFAFFAPLVDKGDEYLVTVEETLVYRLGETAPLESFIIPKMAQPTPEVVDVADCDAAE